VTVIGLHDAFLETRRRDIRITIAGTRGAEILPELERDAGDAVIVKKRYSAFFGTQLEDLLARLSPGSLVLAGINTHACVRTTAIVILAADCVGSHDEEHHRVTMKYLDGKIARVLSNEQLLAMLAENSASHPMSRSKP
jgi:nicotinamidase-related amidase